MTRDEQLERRTPDGRLVYGAVQPEAWRRHIEQHGEEPLDDRVVMLARVLDIDAAALDWQVEAMQGWERHDAGYAEVARLAAVLMRRVQDVVGWRWSIADVEREVQP